MMFKHIHRTIPLVTSCLVALCNAISCTYITWHMFIVDLDLNPKWMHIDNQCASVHLVPPCLLKGSTLKWSDIGMAFFNDMFNDIKWHNMTGGRQSLPKFCEPIFAVRHEVPEVKIREEKKKKNDEAVFTENQGKWANTQKIAGMSKTCPISSWSC